MQRSIDLTLAVLATVVSVLLSLPYWPSYSYWAVSPTAWWVYIALGAVLAVYVFYVFFRALRTMFVHEGHHAGHHHHPSERPHEHELVTDHVARHPADRRAIAALGRMLAGKDDPKQAAAVLAHGGGNDPLLLADLARAQLAAGNTGAAREAARRAYALQRSNGRVAEILARALQAGEPRQAEVLLAKARSTAPLLASR